MFIFLTLFFTSFADPGPIDKTQDLVLELLQEPALQQKLEQSAIQGMLKYLDDKVGFGDSKILTSTQKDQMLEYKRGLREGYGLRVQIIDRKGFLIEHIFEKGSAEKSGLRVGDVILSVGEQSLMNKTEEEMISILHRSSQAKIRFDVLRNGHLISFDVLRGEYELMPVSVYGNVIQIHYFSQNTAVLLKKTLQEKKFSPIILDLRNNEGGLLEEVKKVFSLFSSSSLLGYRSFIDGKKEEIRAEPSDVVFDQPLYILINHQTSHVAELFVAAMMFYKRAITVGEKTAGIASEHHFYPLNEEMFLYIADSQLMHLEKRTWEKKGFEPSIVVRSAQPIVGNRNIDVQLETVLRLINPP